MNNTLTFKIQTHIKPKLVRHVDKVRRNQRKHGKRITASGVANELVERALDHEVVISKIAPEFKVLGDIIDNQLHIRDDKLGRVFTVTREHNRFRCLEDDATNCNHVLVATHSDKAIGFFDDEEIEMIVIKSRKASVYDGDGET